MNKQLLATSLGNFIGPGGGIFDPTFVTGGLSSLETVVSWLIAFLTVVGGIYFIFLIIIGTYQWMSGGGDKQKLQKARDMILNAIIGLVVLIAAYGIVSLAGYILGFSILQPAELLGGMWSS